MIGASGVGLVCWPLSLVAVVTAIRRVPTTAFVAAVVGATLVVAGIADVDAFRYSQVPFAGPADLDRLLVAITLGGGAGLAAGGFAAVRRIAFSLREAVDASPADDFSSNAPFPDVAPSNGPSPDVALSDGPSPDVALSDGPSPDVALSDGPSPDVALSDGPSPDRPPPDSSLSEAGLFTGFPSDADPSSGFSSHASSSGVSAPDAYSDGITR